MNAANTQSTSNTTTVGFPPTPSDAHQKAGWAKDKFGCMGSESLAQGHGWP
jgi:hypothetical protein